MLRFDIINYLIKKYNYKKYLEIGVEGGDAFKNIKCDVKHGVDPASVNATFRITSDEFFGMIKDDVYYDIIFIDGLHVEEQVDKDIQNALAHLSKNGIIVVHDCNPPTQWHQRPYEIALKNGCRQWNGTVWRSIVKLRSKSNLDIKVVNTDWGCGLIKPDYSQVYGSENDFILPENFEYDFLENNRKKALNLITVDEFFTYY